MKIRKLLLVCACMGMFTGCSGNKVEYETEAATENFGDAESVSEPDSLEQFASVDKWKEDFGVPCDKYTNYKIDAKLTIPDAKHMSLIELKSAMTDEKEWEKTCDVLFETYAEDKTAAPVDYMSHNEYKVYVPDKQYVGVKDNIKYLIGKYTRKYQEETIRTLMFQPINLQDVLPVEVEATDISNVSIGFDAEASLGDYSEAQEKADEFLEALGMNEYVVEEACVLGWYQDMGQNGDSRLITDDGYIFSYTIQCNDSLAIDGENYDLDDSLLSNKDGLYHLPNISIAVNDKGVIWSEIINPLQSTDTMTKVNLLSMDKVLAALKVQLKDNSSLLDSSVITGATLTYTCVPNSDSTDEFSIVPAWRFETYNSKMYINAVDGSPIN